MIWIVWLCGLAAVLGYCYWVMQDEKDSRVVFGVTFILGGLWSLFLMFVNATP